MLGNPYHSRGDSLVIIAVTRPGLVPVLLLFIAIGWDRDMVLDKVMSSYNAMSYNLIGIRNILTVTTTTSLSPNLLTDIKCPFIVDVCV